MYISIQKSTVCVLMTGDLVSGPNLNTGDFISGVASFREAGDWGWNKGAPVKYGISGNPTHYRVRCDTLLSFTPLRYIIEDRRPPDRPTRRPTDLAFFVKFWKISNGYISGTGRPFDFVFDTRVGCARSTDRMALFPVVPNPRWRLAAILENFKFPYLCNGSSDRLRIWS